MLQDVPASLPVPLGLRLALTAVWGGDSPETRLDFSCRASGTPFDGGFSVSHHTKTPDVSGTWIKKASPFEITASLVFSMQTVTFLHWLCTLKIFLFFSLNTCHWICKTFQICWLAWWNKHLVFMRTRLNLIRVSLALADAERCKKKI